MDFEYLDAFARPNAAKGYEKPPAVVKQNTNTAPVQNTDLTETEKRIFGISGSSAVDKGDTGLKTTTTAKALVVAKQETVVAATPNTASLPVVTLSKPAIKTAPIDTILFDDNSVSVDKMFNLILEDIGGQELINIARNDIINGQQVSYQPIKNLSSIQQQYNQNNILGIQNTSDKYFSNFSIKLENKIPNNGNGPSGSNVYLENLTGSLVIETVNMESDEQIEVEVTVSATIYEAEFGEINS